jgi:DNA-binding response OmpR family regulator
MNVLIIEDERGLAEEVVTYLSGAHYLCETAFTGQEASEKISVNLYDFILLDLGLPDYEGLDLLQEAKKQHHEAAIIIITARGAVEDRIKGLDLGADDYLPKPFALPELLSRMNAIARRKFGVNTNILVAGLFQIDMSARTITCEEQVVNLTKKEYDLLLYLLINKNKVLTRMQLYEHIWGNELNDDYDSNFIDVHMKNLRKKLSQYASVDWLETVRGVGYRTNL